MRCPGYEPPSANPCDPPAPRFASGKHRIEDDEVIEGLFDFCIANFTEKDWQGKVPAESKAAKVKLESRSTNPDTVFPDFIGVSVSERIRLSNKRRRTELRCHIVLGKAEAQELTTGVEATGIIGGSPG